MYTKPNNSLSGITDTFSTLIDKVSTLGFNIYAIREQRKSSEKEFDKLMAEREAQIRAIEAERSIATQQAAMIPSLPFGNKTLLLGVAAGSILLGAYFLMGRKSPRRRRRR